MFVSKYLESIEDYNDILIVKKLQTILKYEEIDFKDNKFPKEIYKELKKIDSVDKDFSIALFKNLLLESRLFRKFKGKLIQTKKYKNLSLKEKLLMLADKLDTNLFISAVVESKKELIFIENLDLYLINELEILKNELFLTILYDFGIVKKERDKFIPLIKIEEKQIEEFVEYDGHIEPEEIEKLSKKFNLVKLFNIAIREGYFQMDDEEEKIVNRLMNSFDKFASMEEGEEEFYAKWLREMAKVFYKNLKEVRKIDFFSLMNLDVSEKVKKDLAESILLMNLPKVNEEIMMLVVMSLIEFYLNRYYGMFEGY